MDLLDELEDYRIVEVPTRTGFTVLALLDDGVVLVASIDLEG